MSFHDRLKKLEEVVLSLPDGATEESQYREFQKRFEAASPRGRAIILSIAPVVGTRDARRIIRSTIPAARAVAGELGRLLGAFAKESRMAMPGAKVIRCRHGENRIIPAPNPEATGRLFLQLFDDFKTPERISQ